MRPPLRRSVVVRHLLGPTATRFQDQMDGDRSVATVERTPAAGARSQNKLESALQQRREARGQRDLPTWGASCRLRSVAAVGYLGFRRANDQNIGGSLLIC